MKKSIKRWLSKTPYEISNRQGLDQIRQELEEKRSAHNLLKTNLRSIPHLHFLFEDAKNGNGLGIAELIKHSHSQIGQDLFALSHASKPFEKGFFVEFGATDGIKLSNTYLLEKCLGWEGILAEPAHIWHADLVKNRTCAIDLRCVSSTSHETIEFLEVAPHEDDHTLTAELSTTKKHAFLGDWATDYRKENSRSYLVETISLNDLLRHHNAPHEIDYLSIDTEGSELEILESMDFSEFLPRVITVEHNYTANRPHIFNLLTSKGYLRIHEDLSQYDDWYILAE